MAHSLELDKTHKEEPAGLTFRGLCAWVLGVLLVACGIVVRVAPMQPSVRVLLLVTLFFTIFTGAVFLLSIIGRRPMWIFPAVFFAALFLLWATLSYNTHDVIALRDAYSHRLQAYLRVPYAPGGEAENGVDASGLARAALWQAMVRQGIKEFNSKLLGPELWNFWWRDLSTRDIAESKYQYTRIVGRASKLAGYDTSHLKIGDMAISGKSHVVVYCGLGEWIEASPVDGKVVAHKAPAGSKRKWFNKPVVFVRWWILDTE